MGEKTSSTEHNLYCFSLNTPSDYFCLALEFTFLDLLGDGQHCLRQSFKILWILPFGDFRAYGGGYEIAKCIGDFLAASNCQSILENELGAPSQFKFSNVLDVAYRIGQFRGG